MIFTVVSAVLQLVVIKGSKRLASTKIVVIGSSVFYSTLWMVASLVVYIEQGSQQQCKIICSSLGNLEFAYSPYYALVYWIGFILVIGPCIGIIIVSSIWSCVTFKKGYTGGNAELNQRMISLPILILLPIQLISDLIFLIRVILVMIFDRYIMEYSANWLIFAVQMSTLLINNDGPLYPLVLAYIHPQLRSAWKEMLKKVAHALYRKCFNTSLAQVHPSVI